MRRRGSREISGSFGAGAFAIDGPEIIRDRAVRCVTNGRLVVGASGGAACPAAAIAAAFFQQREGVLADLDGEFVVAVWDGERREGLIAVDRLGVRSLFHTDAGGRLRFAEEIRTLLPALPSARPPAAAALARWLASGALDPDETLYEGVHRLPGGHYLRLRDGRWSRHRYWAPRYVRPLALSRHEAVGAVRESIGRAVSERIPTGPVGVMLSGGIDSSSVTAVATTLLSRHERLNAYSATFPEYPEADESALISATSESLGIRWRPVAATGSGVMAAAERHVAQWRLPPASPNLFFQEPVLAAAAEDGIGVVLDGQGGDELFGCVPQLIADCLRSLRFAKAWATAGVLAGSSDRRVIRKALRIYGLPAAAPSWLHALRARHRSDAVGADSPPWTRLDGPRWWATLADQLTVARERLGAHDHLRRKFASAGLVGAHPYFDDAGLVELVLRLPPELAFDPVLDRPLLREAVAGLVPDPVRLRQGKSFFDAPLVAALNGPDRPMLERVLRDPKAALREYVTPQALASALEPPPPLGRGGSAWAWRVWRLGSTELWLRSLENQ